MEAFGIVVLFALGLLAMVALWAISIDFDKKRIRDYVHQRGGRIVSITWAPFGKGWFGEREEAIYEVVYYDKDGAQHFATAKTTWVTGAVYWTDDRVTHAKPGWYDSLPPSNEGRKPLIGQIPRQAPEDPGEELARLREENARLREQLSGGTAPAAVTPPGTCPACGAATPPGATRCPACAIALR